MKKGVSPLVAAVLLIAATMSIAGILAYWASSFVRTQTTQFENQSIVSECKFADFKIYSCFYNTTSKKLNLVLENYKELELKDLMVYIQFPNGSMPSILLNETLSKNSIKSFVISDLDTFNKVIVKTHCPEISQEKSCK